MDRTIGHGPAPFLQWLSAFAVFTTSALIARADITLDGTLGPSGALQGPNYRVEANLGEQVGSNLFHSFGRFGLGQAESATFAGPASVDHIIGRITGGEASHIDGTLRTEVPGGADLWLINPTGIVFGENASLDVQGSFHASTGDYLRLGESGIFDARDPGNSVLSTDPPSAFGFLGDQPASITVGGSSLEMPAGESLSLVGGDIELTKELATSSNLLAPSGRVNIASVASSGEVIVNDPSESAGLNTDRFSQLGHIRISRSEFPDDTNQWVPNIVVNGDPGGSIVIRGGQLTIEQGAMQSRTEGSVDHPGASIDIDITGKINLAGEIDSSSSVSGRAGDIQISANRLHIEGNELTLQSGATFLYLSNVGSRVFGAGDGGNIDIKTDSLKLENGAQIGASVEFTGSGSGGDVAIVTNDLQIAGERARANITTSTFGTGDAGDLTVSADEVVMRGGPGFSGLSTQAAPNARGSASAGDLRLTAENIRLLDGAQINATVFSGNGDSGNIEISADTIDLDGADADGFVSGIFASSINIASSQEPTTGDGGDVNIVARTLRITDRARMDVFSNNSSGNPGDVNIKVSDLKISNGSFIANSNFGVGERGGTITILADQVRLEGPSPEFWTTGIFSLVGVAAPSAGEVRLTTSSLAVLDGAEISSATAGPASAGTVTINADHVLVAGEDTVNQVPARIDARTFVFGNFVDQATGRGGDIALQTQTLVVRDGGQITASSTSAGDGGDISLLTTRTLLANDASISAQSTLSADAGSITIFARDQLRSQGSSISAGSDQGAGGNVAIQSPGLVTLIDSGITTDVASGAADSGNIVIANPVALILVNGSRISANAAQGRGGSVTIKADTLITDRPISESITATSENRDPEFEGEISIESAGADILPGLATLSADFLKSVSVLKSLCTERSDGNVIQLYSQRYQTLPDSPYALRTHVPSIDGRAHSGRRAIAGDGRSPAAPAFKPVDGCEWHG